MGRDGDLECSLTGAENAKAHLVARSRLDAWGAYLRRALDKQRPGTTKELGDIFAWMPEHLRNGPWSWAPTIFICLYLVGLVCASPSALETFQPMPEAPDVWGYRVIGLLYGLFVTGWVLSKAGSTWPLVSWTILGWICATVRYLTGVLGLVSAQRVLTFPSLMANTVTVVVWYTVLVPGFVYFTEKGKKCATIKGWVLPPLLITVHGINFPFCVADWYLQPFKLELFDLWAGCIYCVVYLLFYVLVLDQMGVFFYFILSPRAWWGSVVYAGILAFTYTIWTAFNSYAPGPL